MKINVYYGGRGLLDDPTLYVLKKMEDVLRELRVNIERFNIYEHKNEIATLPLFLPQRLSGWESVVICSSFWMPAGYMVIRKKSAIPICSRLLCPQPMESAREN